MKVIKSFFYLIILLITQVGLSQTVSVIDSFEKLESSYFKNNDTTYVINFWATWCMPCVKELPYFEKFNVNNQNKKIKVLLVSLDFKKQLEKKLIPFVKSNKLTSEVVLLDDKDYNGWLSIVNPEWSGSIPATLLINGNRRKFVEQEFEDQNEVNEFIYSFINKL